MEYCKNFLIVSAVVVVLIVVYAFGYMEAVDLYYEYETEEVTLVKG